MINFDLNSVADIKTMVRAVRNKALEVACVLTSNKPQDVVCVILYKHMVEVKFETYSNGHLSFYTHLSYEDVSQDVDSLIKRLKLEKEQKKEQYKQEQILEIKRGKAKAEKINRETYLRLKAKYENK